MKTIKTQVLVVGGGPVGMAAALCLHNRGVQVEVIEAEPRGGSHSYALGLHAATRGLLAEEGIGEALDGRALGLQGLDFYCSATRVLQVPHNVPESAPPFFSAIGQNELENLFAAELERRGVKVHWNHRLAHFSQTTHGVRAEVHEIEERMMGYAAARLDRVVARKLSVECEFMLAADGHHSLVRRQLGIDFSELGPTEHYAVFEFASDYVQRKRSALVFDGDLMNVFWPLPDNLFRWSFQVEPDNSDLWSREKDRNLVQILGLRAYPALNEDLLHYLLQQRAPWFDGSVDGLHWRMLVRFEKRLAERFGEGRIWMAGDAAHMSYPAGVQSMNVGIRESRNLAGIIAGIVQGKENPDRLQDYERDRRAEWHFLLGLDGPLPLPADAHECLTKNAVRLISALPASGPQLLGIL